MSKKLLFLSCFAVLSLFSTAQNCLPSFTYYTNVAQVSFNSNSSFTGNPAGSASYHWDFGDGNTNVTSSYPNHSYAQPGVYPVCLTMTVIDSVTNTFFCSGVFCDTVVISASCNNTTVTADRYWYTPGKVEFDCTVSSSISNTTPFYLWNFDDGTLSTVKSPIHNFNSPGSYNVKLTVDHKDPQGFTLCSDTVNYYQYINQVTLSCDVSFNQYSASTNPLDISFSRQQFYLHRGQNSHPVSSYSWDFGDGTAISNTNYNPNHVYSQPGTYVVCVTRNVVDSLNSNDVCTSIFCDTVNIANACFTSASGERYWYTPATINFTGSALSFIGIPTTQAYTWDFGDGGTSNLQSPSHTYTSAGSYTVCLKVDHLDSAGSIVCSDTSCFTQSISRTALNCGVSFSSIADQYDQYDISFQAHAVGLYRNANSHPFSSYTWTFGDGSTANGLYANNHQYSQPGTYIVCLNRMVVDSINTNDACSYLFCDTITIDSINPHPWFCKAQFYFDSISSSPGNIIFVNNSIPPNSSLYTNMYSWDFGDGTTSNLSYPQHTYASSGVYTLCLTLSSITANNDTCTTHWCKTFRIDSLGSFNHFKAGTSFNINIVPPPSGIDIKETIALDFDLFPNPASNRIQIKMGEFINGNFDYKLMNANGSVISVGSINESKSSINVSDLANGIYFINLSNSEISLNKKFQVNR